MRIALFVAALLTLISCEKKVDPALLRLDGMPLEKEGHRGCRGIMPENTIPGFLKATDLGVTILEMDAVISKDSQVVISHNPWFTSDITTKPNGAYINKADEKNYNIYKMNYEEIRKYDVGMKPNPDFPYQAKLPAIKPLLKDVIDSIETHVMTNRLKPVYYSIEIKTNMEYDNIYAPDPPRFTELLMKVILDKGISSRVIIECFDMRSLKYLHQHYPEMKTSLLSGGDPKPFSEQLNDLGFMPTIYSPSYNLVTTQLVAQCHKAGIKLIPWTLDNRALIRNYESMGVDGIITDYPDLF